MHMDNKLTRLIIKLRVPAVMRVEYVGYVVRSTVVVVTGTDEVLVVVAAVVSVEPVIVVVVITGPVVVAVMLVVDVVVPVVVVVRSAMVKHAARETLRGEDYYEQHHH